MAPRCETVVSFLIDNSGSMKRQRYEAVAVMVDIYSRALDLAGVANEILGFTTGGWTGGQTIESWRRAGSPENPGRLNDRLHVVYKDADTPWRRARDSIATLLSTHHFREGLDGEALEWAAGRLRRTNAARRCLVMISDGAPMDSATSQNNPEGFLTGHMMRVIRRIERAGEIELAGIGIDLDLDAFYDRSLVLDLTGTLGNAEFRALESLFRPSARWN
jgi:cobaltochelatase CobT